MRGIVYRLGVRLKEAGERSRCDWLVLLGLRIRDWGARYGKTY